MTKSGKIVAVLMAAALTGCASKGDLEDLRKEVNASEANIKAIDDKVSGHENRLLAQDARLAEAEKSVALATKQFSEAAEHSSALAQEQAQLAKQLADIQARVKTLDESLAKASGQLDKDETQIANLTNETKTWNADLKDVKDETAKLNAAVTRANATYRKSLENLRDIYKRQFEAVSEILDSDKE
jgi:chromosome segregation ATPase